MEVKRRNLQGVLNILSFNRQFYVIALGVLSILTLTYFLAEWQKLFFWLIVAAFMYGLMMPLLVSAYVYDFSGYYKLDWLKSIVGDRERVKQIVNINAGFDETSFIIKSKFPESELTVVDFYDAKQHTAPAIIRARKVSLTYPTTQQAASTSIPLADNTADIVFLLSAAHEIRSPHERVQFLRECHRLCKLEGRVIMVEHLRDLPNFLAFTIGVTHFFSRSVWKNAFERAGFSSFQETKFTPFMSIFTCSR
jgi:ubiquinone/menaquinone biosynthesis C-methylase UbiE